MDDSGFLARSAQMNRDGLAQLQAGCDALGLAYVPSRGNFLTVDFGQPADAIYDALLHEGVILRPLQPYQMPNHLRVTVGTESDNQRVLAAFKKVLAEVRGG
jgi:histidinol-phosphate aminotransferase